MIQKNTILIVDDQRSNVEFIADILSNTYDVKAAIDGKKALKLLEKFEFDLILLDVQMPDMNGYEVAQKILSSERTKDTPIIFLTSLNDEASIVKGFEMGAVDYVTKPFNTQELLVRVANHIQMHDNHNMTF
ncbi:MAG: response regulator [Campylobacterota bacterium]|nr:response regulator [Campylobacterota bacterium]